MERYDLEPIGFIKSPYREREEIPRQGFHAPEVEAVAVVEEKWAEAMRGLEGDGEVDATLPVPSVRSGAHDGEQAVARGGEGSLRDEEPQQAQSHRRLRG